MNTKTYLAACALLSISTAITARAQTIRSATGADAASITAAVNAFRNDLGVNNGVGVGGVPGVGRREVNWDGVPDTSASPNPFPGDFFNQPTGSAAGRIRGIQFTTTGTLEVSADSDNPAAALPLFANRHPDNDEDFAAFSAERIFGILGSNVVDVTFSIPGTPGETAQTRGFGVVFTDVELANAATIELFDRNNAPLVLASAPAFSYVGNDSGKSFSFIGVSFENPIVSRVRITNGGYDLALTQFGVNDATAMDDFIFGEPIVVPEPGTLALGALAVAGCYLARRRR